MNQKTSVESFEPGDILVAATLLNDENDDHAGAGRIIQYDSNFQEKGVIWFDEPGHLIGGLKFAPDGVLWAFDSQEFRVYRFDKNGKVLPVPDYPKRAYSNANFVSDGSILLGEHVVGDSIGVELHTNIPKIPGLDKYGDGHVFRFSGDGDLLNEYATETHGGMGGFLGVTMSALSPDETTLVYSSETGPRLMRYDLTNNQQLPDLQSFPEGQREMFFGMAYSSDGELLVARGNRIAVVDDGGEETRSYPLEGFGWALLAPCANGDFITSNFFSGQVVRVNGSSGEVVGSVAAGMPRSVAGIAEVPA